MAMYRRRMWVGVIVVSLCVTGGVAVLVWSLVHSGVIVLSDFSTRPWQPTLEQLPAAPNLHLTPDQAVRIQLWALRANDEEDRGIALAFSFASPNNQSMTGPVERFGRMVREQFPIMLAYEELEVQAPQMEGGLAHVPVVLFQSDGPPHFFVFTLSRPSDGPYAGCWLTEGVIPVPYTPPQAPSLPPDDPGQPI